MAEPALLPITCPRCSFVAEFKMTNRQASPVLQPYASEYFQRRCVVEKAEQGFAPRKTRCIFRGRPFPVRVRTINISGSMYTDGISLLKYSDLPVGPLEKAESLEQLRALENGFRIRVVETDYESFGVDTPQDLERVRQLIRAANAAVQRGAGTRACRVGTHADAWVPNNG